MSFVVSICYVEGRDKFFILIRFCFIGREVVSGDYFSLGFLIF